MRRALLVAALAATTAGCGDVVARSGSGAPDEPNVIQQTANAPRPAVGPIEFPAFDPPEAEKYPNAKRVAADAAQAATTYARGETPQDVARRIGAPAGGLGALADAIGPVVEDGARSGGEVVYPQLAGVTGTSFGAMVVVRQTLEDAKGRRRVQTRVLDVRLRRQGGPWQLDRIAAVGGERRERPASLSAEGARVVDHPNITLSDSARWDVFSGRVDRALLRRLTELADVQPISVAVLISGHPENVWMTERRSAHTSGFAADIYAVGGRLVVRQQQQGSAAYRLAKAAYDGGARQVGSPWSFGPRSFADDVHADHVHLQQTPVPGRSPAPG